jgi:predicted nucleic acid-binding protein
VLLLDSEAISAVAHGPHRRRDRVRALVTEMRSRNLPVATVAAVLAEVVRGRAADAGVFAGLRRERVEVHAVDSRTGVRAGQLLGRIGADSDLAIDAFLVADGDVRGGAVIVTVGTDDLRRLASVADRVHIADLDA